MFVGFKSDLMTFQVNRLPLRERDRGSFPVLACTSSIGNPFKFETCLLPVTRDEMSIVVSDTDANRTLQATELAQVSGLFLLDPVVERLGKSSVSFGKDPVEVVAEAFGVTTGIPGIESYLRYASWWLKFGLSGNAHVQYRAAYDKLAKLLQFIPGIRFPKDGEVKNDEGQPENYFGETVQRLLEFYRAEIEMELKAALNHEPLKLKVVILPPEACLHTTYAESGPLWQQHFGEMWGPFEV